MCGIAGILYKSLAEGRNQTTGQALIDMLDGCQHRGPDSTGFALYGDATDDQLRLRFFIGIGDEAAAAIDKIKEILAQHQAEIVDDEVIGNNYRVVVNFSGEMWKMAYDLEHVAKVISIGTSLEIIKDVGGAHDVDDTYHVQSYSGTNYWKMRRRLEQRGYEFHTDNDSELIAVYLAEKLSQGVALKDALKTSIDDLDGTFSFLVSTKDQIGYAKDRLAVKPMVMYETDDLIAIASEEVSLNKLFPGQALNTMEPAPGTYNTWHK